MKRSYLKLSTRVALGTGGLAAVLALMAWYGLYAIGGFPDSFDLMAGNTARQLELVGAIDTAVSNMSAGQRGVVLSSFAKAPDRTAVSKRLFEANSAAVR